jgi:hypothetical protein
MKEIPQYLIDECEKLASEEDVTYFIFDKSESNVINLKLRPNKENGRESKIDEIIEEYYHIGTIDGFADLPSRLSHYDTETKLIGRYDRYNYVKDLFFKLGFEPSINNFGPEFEQTFSLTIPCNDGYGELWIVRLHPNLFLTIRYSNSDENQSSNLELFSGFFNRNKIFQSLLDSSESLKFIIRDMKLDQVLV